ncbi:sarcoplasmic calcium-binding proteins I, III, and IV [Lepeophtheirus salmonis]|uniref:sarcoplasmic calcium-binding proteins I, III, and IV n=1 Tax=Lepeophtheirus salmonis TaxID=72036 RepID=UPI001AE21744|nr:uncharacterized protein LOC121126387 [Lepeophtheirus salmonis]
MGSLPSKDKSDGSLTSFQRKKLRYDFRTFFDLNKDGCISYSDFLWAKEKICFMSGWSIGSRKYNDTESLFQEIWSSLEEIADIDKDGEISQDEWLIMWETYMRDIALREEEETTLTKKWAKERNDNNILSLSSASIINELNKDLQSEDELLDELDNEEDGTDESRWADFLNKTKLPLWLYKYFLFRFNLLDRTGDNIIDSEEFEYVLSEFGVKERNAKQAYVIFSKNNTLELDFDYFVHLCAEYYLSDDPSDLGNFINGKLDYDTESSGDEGEGRLIPKEKEQKKSKEQSEKVSLPLKQDKYGYQDSIRELNHQNGNSNKNKITEEPINPPASGFHSQYTGLKIKQKCCLTS